MKRIFILFVLAASLAVFLGACGGGGGPEPIPEPKPEPPQLKLTIDQPSLPQGTVGTYYNQSVSLTASGGSGSYIYSCTIDSSPELWDNSTGLTALISELPNYMIDREYHTSKGATCVIYGAPRGSGAVTVNIRLRDSNYSAAGTLVIPLSIAVGPSADPLDYWHVRYSAPHGPALRGVAYGAGTWVAVGDGGTILMSTDGISWKSATSGTAADLTRVRYGKGMFIAVGKSGTILASSDGLQWTSASYGAATDNFDVYDVVYARGMFVAVGGQHLLRSPDGIFWSLDRIFWPIVDVPQLDSSLWRITYGNNSFIVFTSDGSIFNSPDGIAWTRVAENGCVPANIAFGNGTIASVGGMSLSMGPTMSTSSDGGIHWKGGVPQWGDSQPQLYLRFKVLYDVSYGGGYFVGVGNNIVVTTVDGMIWTHKRPAFVETEFYGVAYGGGVFTAVGYDGTILQSDPVQ